MYVNNVVFDNVQIEATKKELVTNFITGMVLKDYKLVSIPVNAGSSVLHYYADIRGINTTTGASTSCSMT